MSVVKSKRKESKMEYYRVYLKLRNALTILLLKDFGIKNKIRDIKFLVPEIEEQDEEIVNQLNVLLSNKYNIRSTLTTEYPAWYINFERTKLLEFISELGRNICDAEHIYITTKTEYEERRLNIDKAISNCFNILNELQYIIEVIPVDIEKIMPHVELIEKEIKLLKGWRQSDNKFLKNL